MKAGNHQSRKYSVQSKKIETTAKIKVFVNKKPWILNQIFFVLSNELSASVLKIDNKAWEYLLYPVIPRRSLATFRKKLFCKIQKKDLIDLDGRFFQCTFDRAMMYPMVEMAGKERVRLIKEILYVYNRLNPISVDRVQRHDQLRIEQLVSQKQPYKKLERLWSYECIFR